MKQLYFIIAVLLVSGVSKAQPTICDSCCEESFPYTFCSALGGYQFTQCSSNPNADGNAVKSFIPSCVIVDQMRSDALWQPKGPPVAPAVLLSNSDLDNDANEESGASMQFDGDETLYSQIPAQAPVPPTLVSPPDDTCDSTEPYPDPTSPDRDTIYNQFVAGCLDGSFFPPPTDSTIYNDDDFWTDDTVEWDACLVQWEEDSANFIDGAAFSYISGLDDLNADEQNAVENYGGEAYRHMWERYTDLYSDYQSHLATDSVWLVCDSAYEADSTAWATTTLKKYQGAYHQYQSDSTAWMANVNSYVLVFDTTHAQADAQLALNGWLNLCTPPILPCPIGPHDQPCCLHVVMDNSIFDFRSNPTGSLAQTLTPGDTTGVLPCKATSCPSRIIEVNITDVFVATNRQPGADSGISPSLYTLYPVSRTEFYTGLTPPDTVAAGYVAYSFYQLMEHEIGHYLGLNHPEDTTGGHKCHNCYTANPFSSPTGNIDTSGARVVMAQNNNDPYPGYNSPVSLTSEDECQFQKLYCNTCEDTVSHTTPQGSAPCALDNGVSAPADDEFKAEIYPNPTTGACQLQLEVPERELVQVAIYDVLGNQIRMVSSGYENEGPQSISLGTESLPSGNYVCRVRVGDRVSYINLAITK